MLQSPRTRMRAERVHDEALDAAATHSCTAVRDRHAASAQHGVAEHCPREAAELAHVRSACRGGERRGTLGANGERHGPRRKHRAPEGFSTRGCKQAGVSPNRTWGNAHEAAHSRRRSTRRTPCNCAKMSSVGRGGCLCSNASCSVRFLACRAEARRGERLNQHVTNTRRLLQR
jgi:hypothetical protein